MNTFVKERKEKTIEISYLKINEETKTMYKQELGKWVRDTENITLQKLEYQMKTTAEATMRTKLTRSVTKNGQIEPIWLTKEIKEEIALRRKLNKCKRNAKDTEEAIEYGNRYKSQKQKVQILVKETLMEHERKVTEEIMQDKNRSKKIWNHVKKLQGKHSAENDEARIYTRQGTKMQGEETSKELEKEWKKIYQKQHNEVHEAWNNIKAEEYKKTDGHRTE